MWIGSLPLESCIPGNAPWLGSFDAIVVGSLSLCGLGRSFPDDALRVSLAIVTGADLSGPAATGASAGVVSAAATGTTAAVAAATGGTSTGATATGGAAGDDSTDGIGSEFVVGPTRSSAAPVGSVAG